MSGYLCIFAYRFCSADLLFRINLDNALFLRKQTFPRLS